MGISINQLNITIMERYDYLEAIKEDVLNYINENNIVVTSENRDKVEQDLNDTLFAYDGVTLIRLTRGRQKKIYVTIGSCYVKR